MKPHNALFGTEQTASNLLESKIKAFSYENTSKMNGMLKYER